LLGPNAPGLRVAATALLRVMDDIAKMTPEQYGKARAALPQQVAQALRLPPPAEAPAVSYDDFIAWIASERTPIVLQDALKARPQTEEVQP
jgi:uncharacterized protein (DUF2267 family)